MKIVGVVLIVVGIICLKTFNEQRREKNNEPADYFRRCIRGSLVISAVGIVLFLVG